MLGLFIIELVNIVVNDTGRRNSIPCKALYWKDPLLYAICCFRNKFILVVTYGKVPCFYFLEKALSLH